MSCIRIKFGFGKYKYTLNGTMISNFLIKKKIAYSAKN